jgi:ribosomal protein S7
MSTLIFKKFVNAFVKNGSKISSESLNLFLIIELKKIYGKNYELVLSEAVENLLPRVTLRNKKKSRGFL